MAIFSNTSCILILALLSIALLLLRFRERNDLKMQEAHNYIPGNINNMPIIVIVNLLVLAYIMFIMIKNKFWIGKV